MSSNGSNSWLLIVTGISAELVLGRSDTAAEPAAAPVTVPHVALGPAIFSVASSTLAGGFPCAAPRLVSQVPYFYSRVK